MNPTKEFRDYLISQGAALVGIGDLTAVPSSDYPGRNCSRSSSTEAYHQRSSACSDQRILRALYYFERQAKCHRNCR